MEIIQCKFAPENIVTFEVPLTRDHHNLLSQTSNASKFHFQCHICIEQLDVCQIGYMYTDVDQNVF